MLLAAYCSAVDWPEAESRNFPGGIVLRDNAGDVIRVSLGPGDVDCRPCYSADPDDWIVKALVASEDGEFFRHNGVRPLSVLRAAWQNLVCRRRVSGASTITMQTVRLIKPHPKTLWWKFKEAIMAVKMESDRDKMWIVSQYLNRAPFGANFVGIEAAAHGWFGKSAKQLGLGEAAMLAGMVQAPSRFRPDRGFDRANSRRDYVLRRMVETGVISDVQMQGAQSVVPVVCRSPRPFKHPYFCDWFLQSIGMRGERQHKSGDYITSLDADMQAVCDDAVNDAALAGGYSVAAVMMSVSTGEVIALSCNGDYFDSASGQVNTAVAPRPAGSTLKPFLMALAIDDGLVTPHDLLEDAPCTFKGYRPANFDSKFRGLVTARDALVLSLNIPFVRLLQRMGTKRFGDSLRELGFSHVAEDCSSYGLGMAIGNVDVTLMELVGAYAKLARGGDGVCSREACAQVSEMLAGEERAAAALGHVADVSVPRFAWKTGTSSAYRDAWTVMWNPEYVVGVWCGHKRGGFGDRTLVGATAAAPVAWKIARALYSQNDGPWFERTQEPTPEVLRGTARALARRKASPDASLSIAKPEDGAMFSMVEGDINQKIVCRTIGNEAGSRLWWFVDGAFVGESEGQSPFVVDMVEGRHTIVCADCNGSAASVSVSVDSFSPQYCGTQAP